MKRNIPKTPPKELKNFIEAQRDNPNSLAYKLAKPEDVIPWYAFLLSSVPPSKKDLDWAENIIKDF